jgi:hydroxyacyl-ACP dehydratase HTD2-like protein with hotdog domain
VTAFLTCKDLRYFAPQRLCSMENSSKMPLQTSLFQVYLRLRPPIQPQQPKQKSEPWLIVEPAVPQSEDGDESFPTHITLQPPNDSRKRAIERFGFTKIFREEASQLAVFEETGAAETIKSVLQSGRDGLIATLGVTGSGKVIIHIKMSTVWPMC